MAATRPRPGRHRPRRPHRRHRRPRRPRPVRHAGRAGQGDLPAPHRPRRSPRRARAERARQPPRSRSIRRHLGSSPGPPGHRMNPLVVAIPVFLALAALEAAAAQPARGRALQAGRSGQRPRLRDAGPDREPVGRRRASSRSTHVLSRHAALLDLPATRRSPGSRRCCCTTSPTTCFTARPIA